MKQTASLVAVLLLGTALGVGGTLGVQAVMDDDAPEQGRISATVLFEECARGMRGGFFDDAGPLADDDEPGMSASEERRCRRWAERKGD